MWSWLAKFYKTHVNLIIFEKTGIPNIEYKPNAGPTDVLCFKHYNAKEVWLYLKWSN